MIVTRAGMAPSACPPKSVASYGMRADTLTMFQYDWTHLVRLGERDPALLMTVLRQLEARYDPLPEPLRSEDPAGGIAADVAGLPVLRARLTEEESAALHGDVQDIVEKWSTR